MCLIGAVQTYISDFAGGGSRTPRFAQLPQPACHYCGRKGLYGLFCWKRSPRTLGFCNEMCLDKWLRDMRDEIIQSLIPGMFVPGRGGRGRTLYEVPFQIVMECRLFLNGLAKNVHREFRNVAGWCRVCGVEISVPKIIRFPYRSILHSRICGYGFCSKKCMTHYLEVLDARQAVRSGSKILKAEDIPIPLAEIKLAQLKLKRRIRKLCQQKTSKNSETNSSMTTTA